MLIFVLCLKNLSHSDNIDLKSIQYFLNRKFQIE